MNKSEYWIECLSIAADECGASLTTEQRDFIASAIKDGHDTYGMAFYSPPASDRLNEIESEWKAKLDRLQKQFDIYMGNAETAVKKALRQYPDANVTIGEDGEVHRHDGRTTQIQ